MDYNNYKRDRDTYQSLYTMITYSNPCTTIIYCYSSTIASDKVNIIDFFNVLSSFARNLPQNNVS